MTKYQCPLCKANLEEKYNCPYCGYVNFSNELIDEINIIKPISDDLRIKVRYVLKKQTVQFEKSHNKQLLKQYDSYEQIEKIDKNISLPNLTTKLDLVLNYINENTKFYGDIVRIKIDQLFPLFFCKNNYEFKEILSCLVDLQYLKTIEWNLNQLEYKEGLNDSIYTPYNYYAINESYSKFTTAQLTLTVKGVKYLQEKQTNSLTSTQAFVAMWFNEEEDPENYKFNMTKIYESVIKPAIEENNKYKALRIDYKEHCNDINDEMIAEIRKSKFVIADLTGYRGGVYFEAGFAYGLNIPVIYTCHEKWLSGNKEKNIEPVHFDLNHRNIIKWNEKKLDEFKKNIKNRIDATIV